MAGGGARSVVLLLVVGVLIRATGNIFPGVKTDAVTVGAAEIVGKHDVIVLHCWSRECRGEDRGQAGDLKEDFGMHLD